jgi:hypothetical protein
MLQHITGRRLTEAPSRIKMTTIGAGMVLASVLAMLVILQ